MRKVPYIWGGDNLLIFSKLNATFKSVLVHTLRLKFILLNKLPNIFAKIVQFSLKNKQKCKLFYETPQMTDYKYIKRTRFAVVGVL